jgi:MFS family permease
MMASPANRLSDRYGRGTVVGVGLTIMGMGLIILGTTTSNAGIGVAMAVFGLGFGLLFPAATALVTETTDMDERGGAFGVFYAVYSLGVVIGSGMSGLFAERYGDLSGAPFFAGGVVAVTVAPLVWLAGRKQLVKERVQAPS